MKIINRTPFYNEKGEISIVDRAKAVLQFGKSWVDEVEAQTAILPFFEKTLGNSFTLLRNIELPEVGINIPFILVGPPGVWVIYVTAIKGTYRARGEEWGTISGDMFKPLKPNLLTRVEQMGRAVQRYLERKGFTNLPPLEAVLLCADPAVHVDSQRPIVRIVMRDALERFLTTLAQMPAALDRQTIQKIVDWILNPPKEEAEAVVETEETASQEEEEAEPEFEEDRPSLTPATLARAEAPTVPPPTRRQRPRRAALTTKHWIVLGGMFLFWCLLVSVFLFFVIQDLQTLM